MDKFYSKLKKYIVKMEKEFPIELAPHFKYDETTIISSNIANQIYSLYEQYIAIRELWEKEKDYTRLLKRENDELKEELYFYENGEEEYEISDTSDGKEKEYLS